MNQDLGQGQAVPAPVEVDQHARLRLLTAAADVFDRKGYAAASVREIVEQAGITKPVLYYHYGSKEGMLIAILEEGASVFEKAIARAVASPGGFRERLRLLVGEIYELFKRHTPAVRVAHAIYFGPREGLPPFDFDRFDAAIHAALCRLVEEGVANGELREAPIEDLVLAVNGVMDVCTHMQLHPRNADASLERIHRVLDLTLDGLATRDLTKEN